MLSTFHPSLVQKAHRDFVLLGSWIIHIYVIQQPMTGDKQSLHESNICYSLFRQLSSDQGSGKIYIRAASALKM